MAKYLHAKNYENPPGRSWEKCVTDGWTERQIDSWIRMILWEPFYKGVWSCFSEIRKYIFLKLFALIASHMIRINTRKRNTINIALCSKSGFPAKINDEIFQKKKNILGSFLPKENFFPKPWLSTTALPAVKCQR